MRLLLHQFRTEQRLFWRSRELAFFTFLFPIVVFVLLGSVYDDERSRYLLAGMLGYGAVATAFAGLAIVVVIRREQGILKRLRATPLPPWAYFAGILASTAAVYALEAAALVLLGKLLFGIPIPRRVLSLLAVLLLGTGSFAALGLAATGLVRSAEGSSAVINAIFLPGTFVSGAFFSPTSFPRFLEIIAAVLPTSHFIQAVRRVVLDGQEIWEQGTAVAVIAAWGVGGALAAVRGFRWEPREG